MLMKIKMALNKPQIKIQLNMTENPYKIVWSRMTTNKIKTENG